MNTRGITRTARLARLLVTSTLLVLALAVVVALVGADAGPPAWGRSPHGPYGVLQAAGLLFFAFAGYARVATLGEEVREPRTTIPRAIQLSLAITVVVYLLVGVSLLVALGPQTLAAQPSPMAAAVQAAGAAWASPVVRVGAALACLGSLLALVAGVGRTTLAMAREGDLPRALAAVDPRHHVPARAETVIGVVVGVLVLTTDLRGVIGFSSFGVLTYYAVANAAALTQQPQHRRWPRALQVLGFVGCAALAVTLPVWSVVAGAGVLAVGLGGRLVVQRGANAT